MQYGIGTMLGYVGAYVHKCYGWIRMYVVMMEDGSVRKAGCTVWWVNTPELHETGYAQLQKSEPPSPSEVVNPDLERPNMSQHNPCP